MARGGKYQLPSSGGGGPPWPYALGVALLLGALVWFWLHSARPAAPQSPPRRQAPPPQSPPAAPRPVVTTPPRVAPPATVEPRSPSAPFPRPPHGTFELQLALARNVISSGPLDGIAGAQTRAALLAFQARERLPATGIADDATRARLSLTTPSLTTYVITSNDLARLQPIAPTWLGKSQQSALNYETILELVAEKFHAHPSYVRSLNFAVNWSNIVAGTEVRVPDAAYPEPATKAAFVRISLGAKTLQAFDAGTNLIAHFPCSIAKRVEKRPVGELHIAAIAPNPNYTFNPEVFPESAEARALGRKLILPPGPNNPVGTAWISLDLPGYGIHGTPSPEQVGRTESHGCFRLANWNAEHLLKLVTVGTPVLVEP